MRVLHDKLGLTGKSNAEEGPMKICAECKYCSFDDERYCYSYFGKVALPPPTDPTKYLCKYAAKMHPVTGAQIMRSCLVMNPEGKCAFWEQKEGGLM